MSSVMHKITGEEGSMHHHRNRREQTVPWKWDTVTCQPSVIKMQSQATRHTQTHPKNTIDKNKYSAQRRRHTNNFGVCKTHSLEELIDYVHDKYKFKPVHVVVMVYTHTHTHEWQTNISIKEIKGLFTYTHQRTNTGRTWRMCTNGSIVIELLETNTLSHTHTTKEKRQLCARV